MRTVKNIFVTAAILISGLTFGQEVKNPVTQVEFKGEVWQISASETMYDLDWIQDNERMMELCELKILTSKDDLDMSHYLHHEAVETIEELPVLAIPFLSCGVGYTYYQLFESNENFLLFERFVPGDFSGKKKVIVLNKIS